MELKQAYYGQQINLGNWLLIVPYGIETRLFHGGKQQTTGF